MFGPRVQASLVLAGAVLVGAVAGVTAERLRASVERPPRPRFERERPPDGRLRERLPPMFEQLDLTDAQRTAIRQTMERYDPLTRAVMDEMVPRLRALRDSAQADVEALLTHEQRARLAELSEDFWDRRWERGRRGRRGPGFRDSFPPPLPPPAARDSGSP